MVMFISTETVLKISVLLEYIMKDDTDRNESDFASKNKKNDCWDKNNKDCGPKDQPPFFSFKNKNFHFSLWYFIAAVIILSLVNSFIKSSTGPTEVSFSAFKNLISTGEVTEVLMSDDLYYGSGPSQEPQSGEILSLIGTGARYKTVPVTDPGFVPLLDEYDVAYSAYRQRNPLLLQMLMSWILPMVLFFFIWRYISGKMGNPGSGVMSFGKNKAQIVAEGDTGVLFDDVAGVEESKEELVEIMDFLKAPEKYLEIGGKVPKGVLLIGPPGTGKTMLAKAVAGEAKVPFFRISGSDFVEMFVGVGASRVRDLFKQAREKAPCIIFIDELDAIGKSRLNVAAGNDEREQTLNQLLVEMDGFSSTAGVIILAATNRPGILDPALLRPGRFDRQVLVDKPDLAGRRAILKIHSRDVKLGPDADLDTIAQATPGFVGADLANVINEAALLAVRAGRKKVAQEDLLEAIEKAVAGLKKKNRLINPRERKIVAYHETGHALTAAFTEGADPVQKITIVPRGLGALGYTLQTPTEDRFLMSRHELLGRIDVLLGGRAAEEIIFKEISTGAANDISRATDIARSMITEYGMSDKYRNTVLSPGKDPYLGGEAYGQQNKSYSDNTGQYIDDETAKIINTRYEKVMDILKGKKELLSRISEHLLEKETIEGKEFKELIEA